jgi:ATP-dependent Clp protease protease subunit
LPPPPRAKASKRPLKVSARSFDRERPFKSLYEAEPIFKKAGAEFSVRALANGTAEINLYDEIGFWGVTAKQFRAALDGIDANTIILNVNSPGGDVFDGIAMYNDLLAHKASVVVRVTGLAASAASVVAMAGDEVHIAENAFFMIHNAWSIAIGDTREMTARAKLLKKIDGELADVYASVTGGDVADIAGQMDDETWLTSDEAIEQGFADKVIDHAEPADAEARASFDLAVFKNVPRGLQPSRRKAKAKKNPPAVVVPTEDLSELSSLMASVVALQASIAA